MGTAHNPVRNFLHKDLMIRNFHKLHHFLTYLSSFSLRMLASFSIALPDALPIFLLRLATQVDWTREKHCFHGVCKELGNFYAMLPHDSNGNGELNSYVQHQLFPALSYIMLPSKNLTKNGHCTKMTKLSTLYKVFERCWWLHLFVYYPCIR